MNYIGLEKKKNNSDVYNLKKINLNHINIVSHGINAKHAIILIKKNGKIYGIGKNECGQFGNKHNSKKLVSKPMELKKLMKNIVIWLL